MICAGPRRRRAGKGVPAPGDRVRRRPPTAAPGLVLAANGCCCAGGDASRRSDPCIQTGRETEGRPKKTGLRSGGGNITPGRAVLLGLCLGVAACGPVVAPNVEHERAIDERSFVLSGQPGDFVDRAITVGTGLGYRVRQLSRRENVVLFGKSTGGSESRFGGKRVQESVRVALEKDGRTVLIHAQIEGILGAAGQASVDRVIAAFAGVLERLVAPKGRLATGRHVAAGEGDDVRALRTRLGLPPDGFAGRLGCPLGAVCLYERRRRVPAGPARTLPCAIARKPDAVDRTRATGCAEVTDVGSGALGLG